MHACHKRDDCVSQEKSINNHRFSPKHSNHIFSPFATFCGKLPHHLSHSAASLPHRPSVHTRAGVRVRLLRVPTHPVEFPGDAPSSFGKGACRPCKDTQGHRGRGVVPPHELVA
jgi:hypothetical protein